MPTSSIECSQCGSHDYNLLSSKTGEVMCPYCRNKWIVPSLIQKTETEKYLELQAQQPKVVIDNTSDTDKQLMDMFSNIFNLGGCLKQATSLVTGVIVLIIIVVAAIVIFNVL